MLTRPEQRGSDVSSSPLAKIRKMKKREMRIPARLLVCVSRARLFDRGESPGLLYAGNYESILYARACTGYVSTGYAEVGGRRGVGRGPTTSRVECAARGEQPGRWA